MSTRATITVSDENDSFDIYQHHDGYPEGAFGLVGQIGKAQRLAWDLPRFEAADFAAAVVAVLKDRGGSTYLTESAEAHGDRDYHYQIEPLRNGVATQVQLTVSQPSWRDDEPDRELFNGSIADAIIKFKAVAETCKHPRELQVLIDAEAALYRAQEEISALCGEKPDPDTENVYEDIESACRSLMFLRQHLETSAPWSALKTAGKNGDTWSKLAHEAHLRFQR